ncbi:GNAT superfamily N-acetyltransferase [Rhodoligotrophos appendicifer]|uniref:GNAT family N-acetyltransferase n=1 Tax=Rhodoligotrophos appendicifer TaxID=987056 RepID=UPI001478A439|nr:GNAT family N-acetyltransferase [Rhodoligotrophos appendicifer]
MADAVTVRDARPADEAEWRELWDGYLRFYKHELPEAVTKNVWQRLISGDPHFVALVAVDAQDRPLGLAHYVVHPSTWTTGSYCYLEDLFVDPERRRTGIGQALFEEVYRRADRNGWSRVYWATQENNYRGRALYDKIGRHTEFILYERA